MPQGWSERMREAGLSALTDAHLALEGANWPDLPLDEDARRAMESHLLLDGSNRHRADSVELARKAFVEVTPNAILAVQGHNPALAVQALCSAVRCYALDEMAEAERLAQNSLKFMRST